VQFLICRRLVRDLAVLAAVPVELPQGDRIPDQSQAGEGTYGDQRKENGIWQICPGQQSQIAKVYGPPNPDYGQEVQGANKQAQKYRKCEEEAKLLFSRRNDLVGTIRAGLRVAVIDMGVWDPVIIPRMVRHAEDTSARGISLRGFRVDSRTTFAGGSRLDATARVEIHVRRW